MYGPATSSGLRTTSAQVYSMPAMLYMATIDPPTTGVATFTVYDSADANISGKTILLYVEQMAGINSVPYPSPVPIVANYGLYCVLTGTDAGYIVHYSAS
jgi:hypothetical protein